MRNNILTHVTSLHLYVLRTPRTYLRASVSLFLRHYNTAALHPRLYNFKEDKHIVSMYAALFGLPLRTTTSDGVVRA